MVINQRHYVLGVSHVASHTMRCVHGSINKILMECDPGPNLMSRGYGTLVDQSTALDLVFLL